jgi:hypothetical protein
MYALDASVQRYQSQNRDSSARRGSLCGSQSSVIIVPTKGLIYALRGTRNSAFCGQQREPRGHSPELAQEVTGEDRAAVLERVEADRREQIGRAQAAAERRVERRQSLPGRVGKKLLEQARALRTRIGQELGRVKEWVLERFPEPLKQIRARTRELFGTTPKPTPAAPNEGDRAARLEALKAQGRAASEGWRQELHRRQAEERRAELARQGEVRQQQLKAERALRVQAERERTVEQIPRPRRRSGDEAVWVWGSE